MSYSYLVRMAFAVLTVTVLSTSPGFASETSGDEPPPSKSALTPGFVELRFTGGDSDEVILRPEKDVLSRATKFTSGKAARIEGIIKAVVAGPTAEEKARGIASAIPENSTLDRLEIRDDRAIELYFTLAPGYLGTSKYDGRLVRQMAEQFESALIGEGVRDFNTRIKDPATGEYRRPLSYLEGPALTNSGVIEYSEDHPEGIQVPASPKGAPTKLAASVPSNPGPVSGALSGKTVIFNQAHGWLDDDSPSGWRVQRGKLFDSLEDYSCIEFLNLFAVPMMQNAGAKVQAVREMDLQQNMAVVDNADSSPDYVETGGALWVTSAVDRGYVHQASYSGRTDDPWANTDPTRRAAVVASATPTATAAFTPTIPAAGYYNVYVSYSAGTDRYTATHYTVYHTGGSTDFYINQKIDGGSWRLLGNFYFNAGQNSSNGKVVVSNDNSGGGTGTYAIADAVRFGGGMGDVARGTHGVSGKPRWQEEAMNMIQYNGMLESGSPIYQSAGSDDEQLGWTNRCRYGYWEMNRDSESPNAVLVGLHTNAFDGGCSASLDNSGTAKGTTTYRDVDADAKTETVDLTTACHNAVIDAIQSLYLASWTDRGIIGSNSYGECSQNNLNGGSGVVGPTSYGIPGFFFEALFADNTADCNPWKDAKFRYIFARAIQQGVITYFGGTTFPPEPPIRIRVKNNGSGNARLDWAAGPVRTVSLPYGSAATSYVVYKSTNGFGFDNGTDVGNVLNYTLSVPANTTTYFRIAAKNSAGVSIPTSVIAVRIPSGAGSTPILIVDGYTRNDRFLPPLISSSGIGGCSGSNPNTTRRIDPRLYQRGNYIVQHAEAIANYGSGFDSCSAEAVEASLMTLTNYHTIDWIGGQESEADTGDTVDNTSVNTNSRAAIQTFLEAGKNLFVSSSEMAWDLGRSAASTAKKDFIHNYGKVNYSSDDSGTYNAVGLAALIFSNLTSAFSFDDGTGSTYDVRFPDVLTVNGSTACMNYSGGIGGVAATQYSGTFGSSLIPGKVVYMGFPFETITNQSTRNTLMADVLGYFVTPVPVSVSHFRLE